MEPSVLFFLNGSFIYIFILNANVLRRHCIIVEEFMSFRNGSKTSTIANQNFVEKFEGKSKIEKKQQKNTTNSMYSKELLLYLFFFYSS